MNIRTDKVNRWIPGVMTLLMLVTVGSALAEPNEHLPRGSVGHEHFDARYDHNHYYLDRGYAVRTLPRGGYAVIRGSDRYWYDRGQWYGRRPRGWVVVGAPVGVFLTALPPFYTTVWVGGFPYYYANDTYYTWRNDRREYEVVEPPAGADSAGTVPPASDTLFSYPRNGQTTQQQADDRYACHRSAVDQTHYDPTQAGGGVAPDIAAGKRTDYFRAQAACLDARGYSVR